MNEFKDFGLKTVVKAFTGDKIPMRKILDKRVIVYDFYIKPSKFNSEEPCLYMQVSLNDKKHIVFTGSKYLMQAIEKVDKTRFPFGTTIIEEELRFEFT